MRKLIASAAAAVMGAVLAVELPEEAVRGRDYTFCNVGSNSGIYAFDWAGAGVKGLSLATSPQSINLGFELLERYADRLSKDCTVFIPICPFSSIARSRAESKWKSADSRPDVEKNPVTPEAFRQSVEMLLKGWREEFDITDFAAPLSERNRQTFEQKVKVLREGLEMCIRKGWRPILVMPPVSRYYDAVFTDKVWRQYVDDFVAAGRVDGVPYWDYSRDERFRDDANFFNSLMMSRKGAAAFTKELVRRAGDGKDALLDGFRSPPALARPEVWWHWMNGNVSKAGITADLEAMARVGIGGAHVFDVIGFIPEGPVAFGSEAWFDHLLFAHREAQRLGLRLTVANCSGFSASGGPWVTPDDAMKFVVWTETEVAAGGRFSGELPRYKADNGYYEDLCVKAVRLPERLRRGRKEGHAEVSCVRTNGTTVFEFGFARPWAAGEFTFRKVDGNQWTPSLRAKVEVSSDGMAWRTVHDAVVEKWYMGEHTDLPRDIRFPESLSRHYRVTMTSAAIEDVDVGFFARSGDYPSLTYRVAGSLNPYVEPHVREGIRGDEVVAESDVVDLTGHMDASGRLDWQAPQGRWKVLRFGAVANGETCIQPSRAGSGPEVDKFSSSAVRRHFDAYLRKVARLAEIDPKSDPWTRTGIVSALVDSYEAGGQNWTQGFADEFLRRRGRELLGPFFAAMAGFVVGDAARTEAFLRDYRRTCHELFAEGYPDTLAACCEEVGLLLAVEPYGTQPCPTAMYGRKVHLPMAEFWLGGSRPWLAAGEVVESRMIPPVVETAHACGRKYIGAESFTAFPGISSWRDSPYGFKAQGDTAYAQGVNRIVYHTFAHQPWTDPPRYPGMTMGQWGSQFNRMETWWEQVGGLVAYQTRAQYLLQEGRFVGKGKIGSDVRWLRRAYDDGSEGWFVACSSNGVRRLSLPFSVSGRTAEVWNAETGEIRLCGKELVLRPRGSAFVLFRPAVTRGIGAAEKETVVVSRREQKGSWQVEFPFDWQTCSPRPEKLTFEDLVSWPEHTRDDVRHFSGTATYSVAVEGFPAAPGERIWLDLGRVHEIADVRVNGKAYPPLWRPPYRVDVTEALQAGRTNRLEIRVTNLWPNRLIGDAFKPEDCTWSGPFLSRWPEYVREGGKSPTGRSTFTTFRHWEKNSKLLPSGLLGPVVLESRLEKGE